MEDDTTETPVTTAETPEEKAKREEEFRKTNMEKNGASEEFADLDDDMLEEYRQEALGEYGEELLQAEPSDGGGGEGAGKSLPGMRGAAF